MTQFAQQQQQEHHSSRLLIAVAWLVVGIPAAWGVEQTAMKSLALFRSPSPTSTTTAHAPGLVQ